jgi:hypothetical protein
MIIPSKFNGFHDGVRRCFGGGGGDGPNEVYSPTYGSTPVNTNTAANTGNTFNTGSTGNNAITQANFDSKSYLAANPDVASELNRGVANFGDAYGHYTRYGMNEGRQPFNINNPVSDPAKPWGSMAVNTQQGYNTLAAQKGTPWFQSGNAYNELLNQGFTSDQIRSSASSMYGAPSEANWSGMVQDAGMRSPTGRPMAGSDQFYQPVYNASYQNYARPATQFDVSAYGTQPSRSPASATMSRSAINSKIGDFYNTNYRDNPNGVGMGDTLDFMRQNGINRDDFQTWGGVQNYGPQMSMPSMQAQAQQPFNPFSNTSGYGGGLPMTAGYGGFGSPMGGLSPYVTNPTYQMQSPFSSQQSRYQPQMQSPFSYQQQSYQPSYQPQYNPYQQYEQSLGSYNPYQMQSPFSYQQPQQYNPYQQYQQYPDTAPTPPMEATKPQPNYGSSTPIVSRSAGMRGTPNVMRRAEGGIASLMDDVE